MTIITDTLVEISVYIVNSTASASWHRDYTIFYTFILMKNCVQRFFSAFLAAAFFFFITHQPYTSHIIYAILFLVLLVHRQRNPPTCRWVKATWNCLQQNDPWGLPPSQISNPCSFIEERAFPLCSGLTLYYESRPLWVMTCYIGDPPCSSNQSSDTTVGK